MASRYCLKIWQENVDNRLEQLISWIPYDLFNIELNFRYVSPINLDTTLETFQRSVVCPRDIFLSKEYGPRILLFIFSNTGASPEFLHTVIIPDIMSFAWEIDSDPVNLGLKTIKLLVEVLVQESVDEVDHQVIDDSLSRLNFKPATRSSIRSLKRVKLGDEGLLPFKKRRRFERLSSERECSICLDELLDVEDVASMPCGHVYHGGCIVGWLEMSHLCPLCRYQMPN